MKRRVSRCTALLCAVFLLAGSTGCVIESPEPPWIEETYTGERVETAFYDAGGLQYRIFSDKTAEAAGIDPETFAGSVLHVADTVNGVPVVGIAPDSFEGLAVTELTLPETLSYIGARAFRQSGIKKLVLPDTLTAVGDDAFDGCRNLESVVFGTGLTVLPTGMFYGCVALKEIDLPEGVVFIGEECFSQCEAVTRVVLPESLTEIGAYAFWGAGTDKLTFAVPAGVAAVGAGAFRSTAWLNARTETFVTVGDGVLIRYNGTDTEVAVPDGVKYVSDAFAGTNVTKVTLPAGVKECENAWEEVPGIEVVRG